MHDIHHPGFHKRHPRIKDQKKRDYSLGEEEAKLIRNEPLLKRHLLRRFIQQTAELLAKTDQKSHSGTLKAF